MVVGLADAADHLEAVQPGHHDIGNEDVRANFEEAFEAFGPVVCGLYREALAAEGFTDDLDEGLFVFDKEDFDGAHNDRINSLPLPGALVTEREPPCFSAIVRA